MKLTLLSTLFVRAGLAVLAADTPADTASPTVKLDQGTFIGVASGEVNKFRGIPYAKPPYVSHLKRFPLVS